MSLMKAVFARKYGAPEQVLEYTEEYPKPSPKTDEVLVRICKSALNALDWHVMRSSPAIMRTFTGFLRPGQRNRILGADIAGIVEEVGKDVTDIHVGDAAACIPVAGLTALQILRDQAKVHEGQKVLIIGASGGVGPFAVQVAKHFGGNVTAVCSGRNVDVVQSLGADKVIDYTKDDWAKQKEDEHYDVIMDNIMDHSFQEYENALAFGGVYISNSDNIKMMLKVSIWSNRPENKKMTNARTMVGSREDLMFLQDQIAAGTMRCVIAKRYSLKEVAEAMQYLETGHSQGKVVINVNPDVE